MTVAGNSAAMLEFNIIAETTLSSSVNSGSIGDRINRCALAAAEIHPLCMRAGAGSDAATHAEAGDPSLVGRASSPFD
jgi:hypothetical protein